MLLRSASLKAYWIAGSPRNAFLTREVQLWQCGEMFGKNSATHYTLKPSFTWNPLMAPSLRRSDSSKISLYRSVRAHSTFKCKWQTHCPVKFLSDDRFSC